MALRSVVLIGPVAVGKSTVGRALGALLGRRFVDVDATAAPFYAEVGQSVEQLVARAADEGIIRAHEWWQPARVHAVERVLATHEGSVIAFGAGHSHYEDRSNFDRVAALLRDQLVVLLLPHDDPDRATAVLRERCVVERGPDRDWRHDGRDIIREWAVSEQNRELADTVVITDGKTPAEVAREVSGLVT